MFFDNTGGNAFNPWNLLNPVQGGSNNVQFPQIRPGSGGQQEARVTPDAIYADALLAALGDNGGPTRTQGLLPGSPAIDTGSATGAPPADQRGLPRSGAVDIGAFEVQGPTALFASGFE